MRKFNRRTIRRSTALAVGLLMLLAMTATAGFAAFPSSSPAAEKADLLIGFEGAPNPGLVRAFGGEIYAEFEIVDVIAARMTPQQANALRKNPAISYIEPDGTVYAISQAVPWGIIRVFNDESSRVETWGKIKGSGIGVAVLDTGIDASHEDLIVVGGRRFYVQGLRLRSDDNYNDVNGHGTHVAGTIAALDNSTGVVGVAPEASLYAVKVLGDNGSGSVSAIVAGIEWVVNQNDISIINMSLGSSSYSKTFEDACGSAFNAGILVIASAGNSGNTGGTGDNVGYPAKYSSVVAVAASNSSDERASFSSTGPAVELIAPGVSVLSTIPNNSYNSYSGTSMASPHVAGVAALVWAADRTLTNVELRGLLQNTAQDLGLPSVHQGFGLVRADLVVAEALGTAPPEPSKFTVTVSANPEAGGTVSGGGTYNEGSEVTVTASSKDGYHFVNWTEGVTEVSTNASYTFTVKADCSLMANFEEEEIVQPVSYNLTVEVIGQGTTNPGAGTYPYPSGTVVNLSAEAATDWQFEKWVVGNDEISTATINVTMDSDKTAIAHFIQVQDPVTLLNAKITSPLDGSSFAPNSWVNITVKVTDQDDIAVNGASVTVTVNYPVDNVLATYSGTTSADGIFTTRYRVPNRATPGTYTIKAWSSLGTLESTATDVTFEVTAR